MGKYFGTDGIRGVVNKGLDAELALRVGQAAAMVLAKTTHGKKPLFVIGKDTRISSDMLEAALVAGICGAGADVLILGVIPTPAVAFLTIEAKADAGIVISASHNSYEHNGIKIFNGQGFKLSDDLEQEIEELIDQDGPLEVKTHSGIGHVTYDVNHWLRRYTDRILSLAGGEFTGLKVLIDCANGASSRTADLIFSKFLTGCELIHNHPNGVNINDQCGSTHTERLQKLVVAGKYDIGIAFDGDADRCLIVDETGRLINGDKIMGVCGEYMKKEGTLKHNAIVATVMSNLGFHEFAERTGITLKCAAVGDRNVLEMMQANGYNLGGEQSGHLIFLDAATTGDGQLAAVKFLNILAESGKTVSELVGAIPEYPQVLLNIPIEGGNEEKDSIMSGEKLKAVIAKEEELLGDSGRILVRPSGTEALIRVMVEAREEAVAMEIAERIASVITAK